MATRINYQYPRRQNGEMGYPMQPMGAARRDEHFITFAENEDEGAECSDCAYCSQCERCVSFCETVTVHDSFDIHEVNSSTANIAYDTDFLGYTLDYVSMEAKLPYGSSCQVDVYRVSINGAIPYIVSMGPVRSNSGSNVNISVSGVCMVDEVIGYVCGDVEPEFSELEKNNVIANMDVSVEECGRSDCKNITVHGTFCFSNLPILQ